MLTGQYVILLSWRPAKVTKSLFGRLGALFCHCLSFHCGDFQTRHNEMAEISHHIKVIKQYR
jgi:hypothetical protein